MSMSSYYSSMVWANQTQKSMSRHWNLNTYFELSYVLITLLIHGGSLHHIWFHEKCSLMNIDIFQSIIKKEDHTIHIQMLNRAVPLQNYFLLSTEAVDWRCSVKAWGLQLYLKSDPGTGVFLRILQNF